MLKFLLKNLMHKHISKAHVKTKVILLSSPSLTSTLTSTHTPSVIFISLIITVAFITLTSSVTLIASFLSLVSSVISDNKDTYSEFSEFSESKFNNFKFSKFSKSEFNDFKFSEFSKISCISDFSSDFSSNSESSEFTFISYFIFTSIFNSDTIVISVCDNKDTSETLNVASTTPTITSTVTPNTLLVIKLII